MSANPNVAELVLANRLLTIMASRVSENLATFSSWLIGSFAGILALLIANLGDVSAVLPAKAIGTSASTFLFAVGLHVVQRYLAALVAGSAIVTREAEALPTPDPLNFAVVFQQLERADADLPPPGLGEHTGEVLRAIGLDAAAIERLRAAGVIGGETLD